MAFMGGFRFAPLLLVLLLIIPKVHGCESIFNFGDAFSDVGNYEETYFNSSKGHFSNGGLIIDFIAEAFGLPFVPPYLAGLKAEDYKNGANFALVGATAMDTSYFYERAEVRSNSSLHVQLDSFKKLLPSLCSSETDCHEYLKRSLLVVGEIGERDYKLMGINSDVVANVVNSIIQTIMEVITMGATNIMVPGMFPMGCLPYYYGNPAYVRDSTFGIDPQNGCLRDQNQQSEYHNTLLQYQLQLLRGVFPRVNIMYADYYNAAIRLFNHPTQYGFSNDVLRMCPREDDARVCENGELLVNSDGEHFSEAVYKSIASAMIFENYITPIPTSHCF